MEKQEQLLIPLEKYLSTGIHIGTRIRTRFTEEFIFRIRSDGLAILDIEKIDERLRMAGRFLSKYEGSEIAVVGRRENAKKPIIKFCEITGAVPFVGRYLPGTFTNPSYDWFFEPSVVIITDPWVDRVALNDAFKMGIPIVALVDTNNMTVKVDLVIPCNNKGRKALAMVYWILAREYVRNRGIAEDIDISWEEFVQK